MSYLFYASRSQDFMVTVTKKTLLSVKEALKGRRLDYYVMTNIVCLGLRYAIVNQDILTFASTCIRYFSVNCLSIHVWWNPLIKLLKTLPIEFWNYINLCNFSQNLQLTTCVLNIFTKVPWDTLHKNMTPLVTKHGTTSISMKNFLRCFLVYQCETIACPSFLFTFY